jgi:Uri superfamily endonuclease
MCWPGFPAARPMEYRRRSRSRGFRGGGCLAREDSTLFRMAGNGRPLPGHALAGEKDRCRDNCQEPGLLVYCAEIKRRTVSPGGLCRPQTGPLCIQIAVGHMELNAAGTYVIALRLGMAQEIETGHLGTFLFPTGWYLYAGSALGPGGLRGRLGRHLRRLDGSIPLLPGEGGFDWVRDRSKGPKAKRAHWHVDHLREATDWTGAWVSDSGERKECDWAAALRGLPAASLVAPGFGASDCRCPGHLVWVPELPTDDWFACKLGAERI